MTAKRSEPGDEGAAKPRRRKSRRGHENKDEESAPEDPFPNYKPAYRVLILELIILILIFMVVFLSPDGIAGVYGGTANKVGLLRSCNGSSCSGWMGASAGGGAASTPAPAQRRDNIFPRQSAPGETAASSGSSDSGSSDLTSFFLSTGLAAVASFWMSLYTLLLTLLRIRGPTPPLASTEPSEKDETDEKKKKKSGLELCGCSCGFLGFCIPGSTKLEDWRRFAYRTGRIYVFINFWLMVGITGSVTLRAMSETPGTGLYILYFATTLLLIVAFIEISNEDRSLRKILLTRDWRMIVMCQFWCCCSSKRKEPDIEAGRGGERATNQRR